MAPHPEGPPKPKMSRGATAAELQAAKLNKLLANPDKDIYIAPRPKEGVQNTLRAPREMMKNVQGSSAGAGSGEFVRRLLPHTLLHSASYVKLVHLPVFPATLAHTSSFFLLPWVPFHLAFNSTSTSKVDEGSTSD
jgi:hypothetical protein